MRIFHDLHNLIKNAIVIHIIKFLWLFYRCRITIKNGDDMNPLHTEFYTCIQTLLQEKQVMAMRNYTQHGTINCLEHSVAVAYYSFWFVRKLHIRCDEAALIRGAMLHDYFLYDWHEKADWHKWHGFRHPKFALQNAAADFDLSKREMEIIRKHMWPLTLIPPTCREAWIVNGIDTLSSIMETFMDKRPFSGLKDRWFAHNRLWMSDIS